ncbi:hypothetical protein SAMN04488564_102964 [Lentzea waywayandensis]|uniref:Uncharacterized protein n=1 Tax=Lentzea waywayandensis TaxID=84724 RepID=A0A1I6DL53_9PSEU|nr:hypothetical protein [Lentzea waywayandensis]SFR06176.1 hypothetical protein SAMN04488564_102964 [Lentzea waywayandensis]
MNIRHTSAPFTRLFKMLVLSLVLVAGGALGAQGASAAPQSAAVQAAPVVEAAPPSTAAVWSCYSVLYSNGVERDCTVNSGEIRSYLSCSNGWTYYTRWLGRGSWYILQVCPSGYYRTGSGIQSRG